MADVQKENGFTSIANDLLEHLAKVQIAGNLWRLLNVVIRQTYGWGRKVDRISITQFENKTGLKRRHVVRGLKELVSMNMITVEKKTARQIYYGVQKDYEQWEIPDRYQNRKQSLSLPKLVTPITKTGNDVVTKTGKHKIKKETNTKETGKSLSSKETLEAYLLSLPDYQSSPSHLREPIALFINKVRQSNKTKVLAPSRAAKLLSSLMAIMGKFGEDNTLQGIEAVFRKEQKDGFSYGQHDPTGYVRAVAKNLFTQDAQQEIEKTARQKKELLRTAPGGTFCKKIGELLENRKT